MSCSPAAELLRGPLFRRQPRSQVLSPSRSLVTGRREPWERASSVAPKEEKIPLALRVYLAKKKNKQQTTTITNTGEEGVVCKRLLLDLCVLEMVAALILHAKSIDIDKALFCFSELLISFRPEYSQSTAP